MRHITSVERPYRATPTVELAKLIRVLRESAATLTERQAALRRELMVELTIRARELRDGGIGTPHGVAMT